MATESGDASGSQNAPGAPESLPQDAGQKRKPWQFQPGNRASVGHKTPWTPERTEEVRTRRDGWASGNLNYKLRKRPVLLKHKRAWYNSRRHSRKFLLMCSRRTGKSSLGLLLLTERAIQFPKTDHLYVAPVKKHLSAYINPIRTDLFDDCPSGKMPKWKESKNMLVFPNGSRIIFVGSNRDTYESSIRSYKLKTIFIDECREIDDFTDMLESAALPAVFDSDGYLILSSTPAKALDHELKAVQETLEKLGACVSNTVYECGYPEDRIKQFHFETCGRNEEECKRVGHKAAWEREYLCRWVRDVTVLIVPEFSRSKHVRAVPHDPLLYPFYYKFETMDQGGVHKTVVLFCWYQFGKTPSFIVEAEEVFTGQDVRLDVMAARIRAAEQRCGFKEVFRRRADVNDRIAVSSLNAMYGFDFGIVEKVYGQTVNGDKGLKAMVGELRMWFAGDGDVAPIAIHPQCRELIGALENCVWDDHDKFAVSKNYGHADAIAALMYGVLSVPTQSPFPPGWRFNAATQFSEEQLLGKSEDQPDLDGLRQAFNVLSDLQRKY